jgi:hypothetical protein
MVCKRVFDDEESYEIPLKHRRQHEDHMTQLSPFLESEPCDDGSERLSSDGEGESSFSESQDEGKISKNMATESVKPEFHYDPFDNMSNYWWFDNKINDEFSDLNNAVHFSYFPNYFEHDHRVKSPAVQPDEICTTLLDYSPRNLVSVGPEYQADIPELVPQRSIKENVLGTCVIPMPDLESHAVDSGDQADRDCNCFDRGSIGCVRQHVSESRNALYKKLGQKIFEELGFCDMGEQVSGKWSEEEEETFHEIVFSNPASSGKNFWNQLSYAFPSRTKRDLVSYYFNVYMLRIRAEQNRFDPLNVDSDNDEYQGFEDEIFEEEALVESLANHDAKEDENQRCTDFLEDSCQMRNNYRENQSDPDARESSEE